MTEVILKPNQFIIQWSPTADGMDILQGKAAIQIVNPHKELHFDSFALQTLKVALEAMAKETIKN